MTKRLFATVVIAGLVSITETRALQQPADAPGGASRIPTIIAADRHDRSPALKDLPAGRPRVGEEAKEREPRWRRVSRHPANLAPDTVVQDYPSVGLMPSLSTSFEGVNNVNTVLPPDTNGDVGPHHFVQWVNLSFAVYSKGSPTSPPALLYGPAPANTLWSGFGGPCETRNDGDPIVRYDHLADRWVMSQLAVPNSFLGLLFGPFYECIAVSATPDPLGAYYRYQYSFAKLNDYPKLAVWPDGYYMTMNQFTAVSLQWAGQGVVAFDREKMLAGLPASASYIDLAAVDMNLGGMLPADLDGPPPPAGSPAYFAQVDDDAWGAAPDQLQLWAFHVDWANPSSSSFTRTAQLPTAPFDSDLCGYSRNCIPQPGTTAKVDAVSDRLMYRLQYRNFGTHESLVVNHTVDADGADHAGIRWYEIRNPASPAIYQQGTYAPDLDHRWMGSAAMDGAGNLALGFSVSGAVTSPSIRYTGRLATDPLDTMTQGEADLMVGSGSQLDSSGRWGDYSMLVVDPTDDCTFWYTQEYYSVSSQYGWQTRVGSFSFPTCQSAPPSDLPSVAVTASDSTATEAGLTTGTFTVTRTGDTTQPLVVNYAVGGTAAPGADYEALPGTITIPAGAATATMLVTPIDDSLVESNESVIVAVTPDPAYVLGSTGATVTLISDDVPPDLIVSTLTGPATAGAGTSITLNDTTRNQGGGPAQASVTGFYLSTNTTIDGSDLSLGSRPVPQLAGGTSDAAATVVQIPAGIATGLYYVLAKADANGTVSETLETNNTKVGPTVSMGPDLIVSVLTAPSSAPPGGSIAVGDTTKNRGGGSADVSTTTFYLSSNVILDAADVLLGSHAVQALGPDAQQAASTPLAIPGGTTAGVYYLIAKADGNAAVAETQESNNTKISGGISIGADLVETAVVVPATAAAGGSIVVSETVKNQGSGPAASSTTSFYLSTNGIWDGGDVLLGSRAVPPLAAGATHAASTPLVIPADTSTGPYSILAKADSNNDVPETSEANNVAFGSTRVGPDLTVSGLTVPGTAAAGTTITAVDTIKNVGASAAAGSTTRFYLSVNLTVDASDVALGSRAAGPVAAGATDSGQAALTIPAQTAAGSYFVIAIADADGSVVETTETNNAKVLVIRITVP